MEFKIWFAAKFVVIGKNGLKIDQSQLCFDFHGIDSIDKNDTMNTKNKEAEGTNKKKTTRISIKYRKKTKQLRL